MPVPLRTCCPGAGEPAVWVSQEVLAHRLDELGIQGWAVTDALAREQALKEQHRRLERMSMTPGMVLRWADGWSGFRRRLAMAGPAGKRETLACSRSVCRR